MDTQWAGRVPEVVSVVYQKVTITKYLQIYEEVDTQWAGRVPEVVSARVYGQVVLFSECHLYQLKLSPLL